MLTIILQAVRWRGSSALESISLLVWALSIRAEMVPSTPSEVPNKLWHPCHEEVKVLSVTAYWYVLHRVSKVKGLHSLSIIFWRCGLKMDVKVPALTPSSCLCSPMQFWCKEAPVDWGWDAVRFQTESARQPMAWARYVFRSVDSHFNVATVCFMEVGTPLLRQSKFYRGVEFLAPWNRL